MNETVPRISIDIMNAQGRVCVEPRATDPSKEGQGPESAPFQVLVEQPDGEFVLGQDVARAAEPLPPQELIEQASARQVALDQRRLQTERNTDIMGLLALSARRRRSTAFLLCTPSKQLCAGSHPHLPTSQVFLCPNCCTTSR